MGSDASSSSGALLFALLVVVVVLAAWWWARAPDKAAAPAAGPGQTGAYIPIAPSGAIDGDPRAPPFRGEPDAPLLADDYGTEPGGQRCDAPDTNPYRAFGRLYSSADVDPLITGNLYRYTDGIRNVYAARSSLADVHGLVEYSSAGGLGDVGVDVGPFGLVEYGGKEIGADDGIPEKWAFPSTPIRWYVAKQRDNYGPEGATVDARDIEPPFVPDHDPQVA